MLRREFAKSIKRRHRRSVIFAVICVMLLLLALAMSVLLMIEQPFDFVANELVALILLLPLGAFVMQRFRRAVARHFYIPITAEEYPDVYGLAVEIAAELGLKKMPGIFLVKDPSVNPCESDSGIRPSVLLGTDFLAGCRENETPEALRFMLAHQLGHIAAGHNSRLWQMLISIANSVPVFRTAMTRSLEFTADLYASSVAAEGAHLALALCGVGKDNYPYVNPQQILTMRRRRSFWSFCARWLHNNVSTIERFQKLNRVAPEVFENTPFRTHTAFADVVKKFADCTNDSVLPEAQKLKIEMARH